MQSCNAAVACTHELRSALLQSSGMQGILPSQLGILSMRLVHIRTVTQDNADLLHQELLVTGPQQNLQLTVKNIPADWLQIAACCSSSLLLRGML